MTSIQNRLSSKKVAIYIRVSTHWQVDKDSLQVQRRELGAYAEMILGISDYVVFEDPGYSAKNTDRPAYQTMMERLRTGEFSHLLVWKIDRISRNLLDFATMYAELKELGITFISKNEQFDTSSAIGEAMLKIILVFAELERQMTAERVTAVMLSRATNGQWNGGRVPYGYDYDKTTCEFSFNQVEHAVYNRILDLYEEHQSLLFVCRTLTDAGIKTRIGKEWTPTAIHKILTNPFYKGEYRYNVRTGPGGSKKNDESEWIVFEDHHPRMIDDIRFDRIQLMLKRNKRGGVKNGDTYKRKHIHVFGGILRCAMCGSNMNATLDKRRADGWRPSMYACSSRRKSATACTNKYTNDGTVGPFVFNFLANMLRAKADCNIYKNTAELQKQLLTGTPFALVRSIDSADLNNILELLRSGISGLEYKPTTVFTKPESTFNEQELLEERKRKDEIALNRLRTLFLFDETGIPEKEYIVERQKLMDDIEFIDKRLSELTVKEVTLESDDNFLEKASYFLMVEQLLSDKEFDYEKFVRSTDLEIPRAFISRVIDHVEISNSKIMSITFTNGITSRFTYR